MKNVLLSCYLMFSLCAFAQKEEGLEYYKLCNKAELAICDSNIVGALKFYRSAFLINPSKSFSQDLLNAFHCAVDAGYYSEAKQYLKKILYRGVKQKYLNHQIYQYYAGNILDSIKCFVALYPNDSNKQNAYSIKMKELVGKDQGIRQYYIKKGIVHSMGDSVVQLDKAVSNELYQYFLSNGIRNTDTIGHFGGEISNDMPFDVIILHQRQAALRGTVAQLPFDSILYNAIYTYDYPPKYFLSKFHTGEKMDFLKMHPEMANLKGLGGAYFNDTLFVETIDFLDEKKIDEAYMLLGLPSYIETLKKVAFRNKCEFSGGSLTKYKVINTICSIGFCETKEELIRWKKKFQKENHNKSDNK